MLLFPGKDEKNSAKQKTFCVLSDNEEVQQQLSQILLMAGINHVEVVKQSLDNPGKIAFEGHIQGIVIDIGMREDIDAVVTALQALVPRNIWSCVVGQSDSISVARAFGQQGIQYLNLTAQREDLRQAISSGKTINSQRKAIGISVLGCKGGVGNTMIAWQLAQRMVALNGMPTLFTQSKYGSSDMDLLVGKKAFQELIVVEKNLDALHLEEQGVPDLNEERYRPYSFVLLDISINASEKGLLREIIECSSCLIVVIDRSLASVRKVLQVLEVMESIERTQTQPRRVILCLNDSRPVTISDLGTDEIERLTGRTIDTHIRYGKGGKASGGLTFWRKWSPLDELTNNVLGKPLKQNISAARRGASK